MSLAHVAIALCHNQKCLFHWNHIDYISLVNSEYLRNDGIANYAEFCALSWDYHSAHNILRNHNDGTAMQGRSHDDLQTPSPDFRRLSVVASFLACPQRYQIASPAL